MWKSLRNLGERVQILLPEELNTYDVLLNDVIVFSKASLDATVARLAGMGNSHDLDDTDAPDDTDDSDDAEVAAE
jgi:large subunit ribosomal protein L4